jgi:hypothetical protein
MKRGSRDVPDEFDGNDRNAIVNILADLYHPVANWGSAIDDTFRRLDCPV